MGSAVSFLLSSEKIVNDKKIDNFLTEQRNKELSYTKILLLGTGNSGKSTILKQFQLINNENVFSNELLLQHKAVISANFISGIKVLLEETIQISLDPRSSCGKTTELVKTTLLLINEKILNIKTIWDDVEVEGVTRKVHAILKDAFHDESVQQTFAGFYGILAKTEIQISYFFSEANFTRIIEHDYVPTSIDIINCRLRTSGVHECEVVIDSHRCVLYDVGGQRNERKKWISQFDNVNVIIFIVSLTDYCKTLYEDEAHNRLNEAISVFNEIVSGPFFDNTDIILYLNKIDLLEKMLSKHPLKQYFPEFTGNEFYDDAVEFIKDKFLQEFKKARPDQSEVKTNTEGGIYIYQTCATSPDNVRQVFGLCKHIFIKKHIANLGIF